jgi:hypothetical protein
MPQGYYECKHTLGLWKHATSPISFTLVANNFGMKYVNKDDVIHLIQCLKKKYELTRDWNTNLYCGIELNWNYNSRTPDILMPGYIINQLQKYKHAIPAKPQHCPYTPQPACQYSSEVQQLLPIDTSPPLSDADIKHIQQVIGSILYYEGAIDLTVLMALSTIASKQAHGTESTMQKAKQLLDYLATHFDAMV